MVEERVWERFEGRVSERFDGRVYKRFEGSISESEGQNVALTV